MSDEKTIVDLFHDTEPEPAPGDIVPIQPQWEPLIDAMMKSRDELKKKADEASLIMRDLEVLDKQVSLARAIFWKQVEEDTGDRGNMRFSSKHRRITRVKEDEDEDPVNPLKDLLKALKDL